MRLENMLLLSIVLSLSRSRNDCGCYSYTCDDGFHDWTSTERYRVLFERPVAGGCHGSRLLVGFPKMLCCDLFLRLLIIGGF